jgi:hypothetical protein
MYCGRSDLPFRRKNKQSRSRNGKDGVTMSAHRMTDDRLHWYRDCAQVGNGNARTENMPACSAASVCELASAAILTSTLSMAMPFFLNSPAWIIALSNPATSDFATLSLIATHPVLFGGILQELWRMNQPGLSDGPSDELPLNSDNRLLDHSANDNVDRMMA